MRLLSRELSNLRAALAFSHDSGVASLSRYWDWTGRLADAQRDGDLSRAVRLLSAANAMLGGDNAPTLRHVCAVSDGAARSLTPGEYATAWDEGRAMHLETVLTA